ncbi:hypothetical protein TCE0_013r00874 [Talaromyces pinophilus]|uniref:ABM domain-containing protein n=1 Tax=Talaromyces pinophilus TaxID=128442 RepID=A0A698XLC8_TALPI|nr:Dimeric alpha-beta barrel [Penicillium occitanis (nom. inval.)]PCH04896.1 hypothetical protein PENOC_031230 [Penicillium occitanis (nom. inval.)]GAM33747.1 hypothetical protein TCE0_013r00874 [Talaromyces pinophilus]
MSSEGISLQVTIWISPENVPKFFEALLPVYEKVIAEPECTFFEYYEDPAEPGKISWVENWSKSAEWLLQNQIPKEYYKEYFAITEPMFLKPREFKILKRVGPPFTMFKRENGGLRE